MLDDAAASTSSGLETAETSAWRRCFGGSSGPRIWHGEVFLVLWELLTVVLAASNSSPHRLVDVDPVLDWFESQGDLNLSAARCPLPAANKKRTAVVRPGCDALCFNDHGPIMATAKQSLVEKTFTITSLGRPRRKLVVQ